MKRIISGILAMVMLLSLAFSNVGSITAFAATSDNVTIHYILKLIDSQGHTTTRELSETERTTINQNTEDRIRVVTPANVAGYSYEDVEIFDQHTATGVQFENVRFNETKSEIIIRYHDENHAEEEASRNNSLKIVLFAKANQYQVTFDYNGGTGELASKNVYYDSSYGNLPRGNRTGSTFLGWATDIAGDHMILENSIVKTAGNHTLYAQWSNSKYEVTFDANGGICETRSAQVTYGSKYSLPTATRAGYEFAGWYTHAQGGAEVTNSTTMSKAENHTLYAHWTNSSFSVSFDGNGGVVSQANKTVTYLGTYGTLPTANREGYTFDGWFLSREGGSEITAASTVNETGAHRLYAHWTANMYSVSLDANGGQLEIKTLPVIYGNAYGTLPVPEREGYTFQGWYLSNERITEDSIVYITEDKTLVANWIANEYEITFEADPGECDMTYKTVTYDEPYGELPTANRVGYTFSGWYLDKQKITEGDIVKIVDDDVLIAKWTPNVYTVTFHANGGECSAKKWYYTYDDIYGEMPLAEREGYEFDGWWTSKENGNHITKEMYVTITDDMDLYARWVKLPEEPKDEDYFYPGSYDDKAYEEEKGKTLEEIAKESGYSKNQLRNVMNIYQVKAEVAADMMTRAMKLGASYKVMVTEPESIERKKSGKDVSGATFAPLKARVSRVTESSVTVKWKKVKGAAGYVIYGSECGHNYFKLGTTTSGSSYTHKNLKKQTYYRYIVLAYANIDGKQVPISISKNAHGVTKGDSNLEKEKSYGNATKITVSNEKKLKKGIKAGKKIQIKTKISYSGGKHKTHRKIRYETSNQKIATVSSKGIIKTKKKGTCYITIYLQNGLSKIIKVTVK